jgi:hypothetical protein
MIPEVNITHIFQLGKTWLKKVTAAINGLTGTSGIKVAWDGDRQVITLGDSFFNYRPVHCAKPTYDESGNLTKIDFYTVSAFCATGSINPTSVDAEACECAEAP